MTSSDIHNLVRIAIQRYQRQQKETEQNSKEESDKVCQQQQPKNHSEESLVSNKRTYDTWESRFQELLDYKLKCGHCLVPYNYAENHGLAVWVKKQRYEYKQYLKLQKETPSGQRTTYTHRSSMTPARIKNLNRIGFVWNSQQAKWEQMFRELVDYKNRYGDCNVPAKYAANRPLGFWVTRQRVQRREMGSHPSGMILQRVKMLDSIGFLWEAPTRDSPKDSWTPIS